MTPSNERILWIGLAALVVVGGVATMLVVGQDASPSSSEVFDEDPAFPAPSLLWGGVAPPEDLSPWMWGAFSTLFATTLVAVYFYARNP